MNRVLRRREVERITGLGRTQIYSLMAEGQFPRCFPLGPEGKSRSVGWLESEIQEWIEARAATRQPSGEGVRP